MEEHDIFGMYFGLLKMRYPEFRDFLNDHKVNIPTDKVNLFINIETALNYMSCVRDLENKLLVNRKYPDDLKVDIINIAGHYKEFFKSNELDVKIFLYMTDLTSDMEEGFHESDHIEDYRSYYLLKYRSNPKFITLGDKLVEEIIPDVKMLCDYIPNVYFVSAKNVDGGLIPYIIGEELKDRTNIILSGDMHDSQYFFEKNYVSIYYKRSVKRGSILCGNVREYLKEMLRTEAIPDEVVRLFSIRPFYEILLSIKGDKYRSIPQIKGMPIKLILQTLLTALKDRKLTPEMENPMLISSVFPEGIQGDLYRNMMATDIHNSYEQLLEGEKKQVLSQIVDHSDLNTLQKINQTRFSKNSLTLEALL